MQYPAPTERPGSDPSKMVREGYVDFAKEGA
jgi:hypothetical protein